MKTGLWWLAAMTTALLGQPSRQQVLDGLKKAAEFYRTKAGIHGGYHYYYSEDLSYARSEHGEGFTQAEVQREATPIVGMAYLTAYEATRDRYYLDAARETAYALVQGQLCTGGWDYFIEFDPAKRKDYVYRVDGPCEGRTGRGVTNFDDNTTQANIRLLMRVDRELNFQDAKIHEAAQFALAGLLRAQYPNGAWPQRFSRFPDLAGHTVKRASYPESWPRTWPGEGYQGYYTFNDNSIADDIDTLLEAARIYNDPKYRAAAEKGGEFCLLAQMPDPQPGWAQQYDRDMHPAWARRFEPPSITGGEAQSVMKILLVLYRETGDKKWLEPLPRALAYYRKSLLPPVTGTPSEIRRRACPGQTPCLARFMELKTNRPLYITKGTRVSVKNGPSQILDGYELSYSDESVITHYSVLVSGAWVEPLAQEFETIRKADPATLRRPDRLRGLSPWDDRPRSRRGARPGDPAPQAAAVLASLDNRGAWLEDGVIGKADRVVSVFAAREMVLTIGGKPIPVHQNDTIDLFQGTEPPRQKIIRSETFARNVETLCAYLGTLR